MTEIHHTRRSSLLDHAVTDECRRRYNRLATHWVVLMASRALDPTDPHDVMYHQLMAEGQDPAATHGLLRAAEVRSSIEVAFKD